MSEFVTKDSGARQHFDTGAQRDTSSDKTRFDLIPSKALQRVADLYARGASKYDEWNWAKGIPVSRMLASLQRHLNQYAQGDRDEDHLAAVVWNALAIIHYEEYRHLYDDLFDLPDFNAATLAEALGLCPDCKVKMPAEHNDGCPSLDEEELDANDVLAPVDFRDGLITQQRDDDKAQRFTQLRNKVQRAEQAKRDARDAMYQGDPRFDKVWAVIYEWDLQRYPGAGYAGATGTDVATILEALDS